MCFFVIAGNEARAATFFGLNDLPGGAFSSSATAVSANGAVVAGFSSTNLAGGEAFLWQDSVGMAALGVISSGPVTPGSAANGISGDGVTVVGRASSANSSNIAFRWTPLGMVGLGVISSSASGDSSVAYATSDDGAVVVGRSSSALGTQAFRWTAGTGMVGLGDLTGGSFSSDARAISGNGMVVVGFSMGASGQEAFRWTPPTGMVGLGDLDGGAASSQAFGISADGSVVVGQGTSGSGLEAFRWTEATGMVGLGDLDGGVFTSTALGVSADGAIVVGQSNSALGNEAMMWTEATGMLRMRDQIPASVGAALNGWTLTSATAVSRDGRTIVGQGTNPSGQTEAWLAYLSDSVNWELLASGRWDSGIAWSGPALPSATDDVVIDPPTAVTVTGPLTTRTVNSLSIGGSGVGRATLRLAGSTNGDLSAAAGAYLQPNAELALADGRIFSSPVVYNAGLIHGTGTVNADLVNYAGGEVRVAAGESLTVSGGGHWNDGKLEVINGSLEFVGAMTNNAGTGLVAGRGATLRFQGGLTNAGAVALSTGLSDVSGDIDNPGSIIVSGHGTATFYDDVANSGIINVAAGSSAVFFGDLSGNGVGGAGEVFLEGDARPGFSPGVMAFGGDVSLGAFSGLDVQIGGTDPSSDFDRVTVAGKLTLGGALHVTLIGELAGAQPAAGSMFDILDWQTLTGTFSVVDLPELGPGLVWDDAQLYTAGVLKIASTNFLASDFDLDGDVDGADLALWKGGFGTTNDATRLQGDADGDQDVDGGDFLIWQQQLNGDGAALANSAAAPEPSSVLLLAAASAMAAISRGRRRR